MLRHFKSDPRRPRSKSGFALGILMVGGLICVWQARWVAENKELFRSGKPVPIRGPNQSDFILCLTCRGLGHMGAEGDEEPGRMCPGCFGVGGNYVLELDELDEICLPCAGMGQIPN